MLDGSIADDQLRAGTVSPVKAPASDAKRKRRRKTLRWFVIYTLALFAIAAVSVWKHQWSVAVTTVLIAAVFFLMTRWFARRR